MWCILPIIIFLYLLMSNHFYYLLNTLHFIDLLLIYSYLPMLHFGVQ